MNARSSNPLADATSACGQSEPHPALGECLRRWAHLHASRTALVDEESRMSFADLDRRVDRLAAGLHALGLRSGDRAMLQLPNGMGFVTACFALLRLGVIPVLAMPTQRAHDIDALCRLAEPVAYFVPDQVGGFDYRPLAAQMAQAHPCLRAVVIDGEPGPQAPGTYALATLEGEPQPWPIPAPGDTALLLLSGGTTGVPKLIARTHRDYAYNFSASAELCGLDETTVYLAVLPIAHNFTLACPGILGTLARGGTVVLSRSASCDEAMPLIERERVTHVALVPPLAQLWVQARDWEDSDLSSLRLVQIGGSRLEPALARRVPDALGPLQQVFGMAEGLLCYTRLDDPADTILHTQGRPLSPQDQIRIVDEHEQQVPPGQVGQLLTRGPYTIASYYRASEQHATSFTRDGYYRTGDLVRQDPAGNLIVEGRIKEQIQRGGEKISTAEVEYALGQLAGVGAAVVVGVPDALLGERICAFVQPSDGGIDTASLREVLRAQGLSAFKLPDQAETIAAWPLTPVGKIDKQRLIAIAQERRASASEAPPPTAARYAERSIAVTTPPLELATRLAATLESRHYTLYEHGDECSIGLEAVLKVMIEPDGTVRRSDAALGPASSPYAGLAQALAGIPFDGWRAYGRADFELAHLMHGLGGSPGSRPLLTLSIPRAEIRLRPGQALLRALDAADLDGLQAQVLAQDAASEPPPGQPVQLAVDTHAGEEHLYKQQVAAALAEMHAHAYQKVILSRTVEAPADLDLVASYLAGRRCNTPARSFLLRDDDFQAYGFSPETVVEIDALGRVSTQPLAGTRALCGDSAENERLRRELLADPKEIAEHAVSVKLALQEMALVCSPDSLGVSEFMEVSCRGSVQHLASRVSGRLAPGRDAWSAFETLFPAVTASGIPKREALDSIRRHEAAPRGLYSGCVLLVDSDGAMDAALVLRAVYRHGERCWLQAGAGLVPSSTLEREWTETCEKLASVACHLRRRPLPDDAD
ncbi:salicylate synthase [Xanthomonas arboricola]|uniref:salicylate synthase n=1 Tax=Xanthomonas arboricola TaxID=56448 RepID=UPI001D34A57E|nr:salicylate synthase [Xanthomonas arboricola]